MTASNTNTPAPDGASAQSDTPNLGQQWVANARPLLAKRDLSDERRRFFSATFKFAERTACVPAPDHDIDLWGYGTVKVTWANNNGDWWAPLHALCDPTGLTFAELRHMYWEAVEDGDDDVEELSWLVDDSDPDDREICQLEMVGPGFAMRAMMSSPWGKEFAKAMMPTFRRALVASGLGDNIRVVQDGEQTGTLTEYLTAQKPLATLDEAREAAFRGPAGAL